MICRRRCRRLGERGNVLSILLVLFIATTTAAAAASNTAAATAAVDERAILLELYQAVGGNAWTNNYGWAENLPILCQWHGVICDDGEPNPNPKNNNNNNNDRHRDLQTTRQQQDSQALVVGIELPNNDLSGRTPDSLWTLPNLTYLDLSDNKALEVSFSKLRSFSSNSNIQTIKIHDTATNTLAGIGGAASSVSSLYISGTPLETIFPEELLELTNLNVLDAFNCSLRGTLPSSIDRLSQLREFNVAGNFLMGSIPQGIAQWENLERFAIGHNRFSGTFPMAALNDRIEIIAIGHNKFMGTFPMAALDDKTRLQAFYADQNRFSGTVPAFANHPNLTTLHLHQNDFTGTLPFNFLASVSRQDTIKVSLAANHLSALPESLENLQDVYLDINLADNKFTTTLPSAFCDNTRWNEGAVKAHGCDGIVCPAGTYSPLGHATQHHTCLDCPTVTTLGSSICPDQDEYSILKSFFERTGGVTEFKESKTWKNTKNWMQTSDYCIWHGVTCSTETDDSKGRVIGLALPDNGLVGTVPSTIFRLKYLRFLNLNRNKVIVPFDLIKDNYQIETIMIANTMTTNFDGFDEVHTHTLKALHADRLPIHGTIPTELFGIHTLEVLSMSESGLKGELNTQIGTMGRLRELYLFDNELRGRLPTELGQLQHLRILSLAANRLTGTLPVFLQMIPNLQAVSLQDQVTKGGGLSGELLSFKNAGSINSLILSNNLLEGNIPEDLLARDNLDETLTVNLSNNRLSGQIPRSLSKFQRMNLYVDGNLISGVDPRLCNMENWMNGAVADFGCNAILCPAGTAGARQTYDDVGCEPCPAGEMPDEPALGQPRCGADVDLTEQAILELIYRECDGANWHVKLNWLSSSHVCSWSGITCDETMSVKIIELGSNQLAGDFPTDVFRLPKLEKLVLYNSDINISFEGIENAKNLKTLILDGTGLDSLHGLGNAPSLEELSVRYNQIRGEMPQDLLRLASLRALVISENAITGEIPFWISTMPRLETFKASSNLLSGTLYDFADMSRLSYIDLSNNRLEGPIPSTLLESTSRTDKIVIDLSNNHLSGTIPSQLGSFTKLSLHLSDNRISGIGDGLCNVRGWNDDDVGMFGCDGILCPAGTGNSVGRQTSTSNPCVQCLQATYMGSTACHGSGLKSNFSSSWRRNGCLALTGLLTAFTILLTWL